MAPLRTLLACLLISGSATEDCMPTSAESSALVQSSLRASADKGLDAQQTEVEKPKWPSLFELLFEHGTSFDEHLSDKARRQATIGALENRVQNLSQQSPAVRQFAESALAFVQTSVIDRIREEHQSQQASLDRAYGQFAKVDELLRSDSQEMTLLRHGVEQAGAEHVQCRRREAEVARRQMSCGVSALQINRKMSAEVGATSLRVDEEQSACAGLDRELAGVRRQCEELQHQLERKGCAAHTRAVMAAEEAANRVLLVSSSYQAWLKNARAEEQDRKKEYASLENISCKLKGLSSEDKQDCAVDTSELTLQLRDPPQMLQLPATPPKPCTGEFQRVQGYDTLPAGVSALDCAVPCP